MNTTENTVEITSAYTRPFTMIFHTGYHPQTETMISGQRRIPCVRNSVADAVISAMLSMQPITEKHEIDPEAHPYLIYRTSAGSRVDPSNTGSSFFITCENFAYLLRGANQILAHRKPIKEDNALVRIIDKIIHGPNHKLAADMNIDNVLTSSLFSHEDKTSPQIAYWINRLSQNPHASTRWITAIPDKNFIGLTTMAFENATKIEPQTPQTLTAIPAALFEPGKKSNHFWTKDPHRDQISISLSDIPKWLISDDACQDAETRSLRSVAAEALSTSLSLIAETHVNRQITNDADAANSIQNQPSYPTELTILFNNTDRA